MADQVLTNSSDFDFIVIGAGMAGSVLAARLSEHEGNSVLLIEAGRKDSSPLISAPGGLMALMMSGRHFWHYESAPQAHLDDRTLYLPRGKVLGGGSSVNGMIYDRGFASDYDRWANEGNSGWSFSELLPYFRKLETYTPATNCWHGEDGPITITRAKWSSPLAGAFVEAGKQAGFPISDDLNGPHRDGFGPVDLTIGNGRRSSAARAYLHPARGRPNLEIWTRAKCERLLLQGRIATGAIIHHKSKRKTVTARREIIVSAGAISSPQLLMLSGIGPAKELKQHGIACVLDAPGVGRNLQDHLALQVRYRSTQPWSHLRHASPLRAAIALMQYLAFKRGPLTDTGMPAACFVRSDPTLAEPDLKMLMIMALTSNLGRRVTPRHGFMAHINAIRPTSVGTVSLASADPDTPPVIDQNFCDTEHDRRVMREGVRIARRIFAQEAFDNCRGEEVTPGMQAQSDAEIDAFVRANAVADFHSVGTARMGIDDMAVVDPELRVRGIDRLRIADASIMPHLPGANTAIPVAMIAEKASDLILGCLHRSGNVPSAAKTAAPSLSLP